MLTTIEEFAATLSCVGDDDKIVAAFIDWADNEFDRDEERDDWDQLWKCFQAGYDAA